VKVRRWLDYGVDIASIAIAAAVGIIVVGLALDSGPGQALESAPVIGPVVTGVKSLWQHVYDPTTT
jgi:hypothetical protein